MARIRIVNGPKGESGTVADRLREAGHDVESGPLTPPLMKRLRASPPDAVVIDLERSFSFGRDIAMWLRQAKSTRSVPLVFLDGEPAKLHRLQAQLPDALYTRRGRVRSALTRALANPPAEPVKPASALAGYAGTPLPRKLGIRPDTVLALIGPPDDFVSATLGSIPDRVEIRTDLRRAPDLTIWFARSRAEIERRIRSMAKKVGRDGIWIAWQKQASGARTDLTQADVRRIGLANGLVDYRICAIDATWAGLRFTRRS